MPYESIHLRWHAHSYTVAMPGTNAPRGLYPHSPVSSDDLENKAGEHTGSERTSTNASQLTSAAISREARRQERSCIPLSGILRKGHDCTLMIVKQQKRP
mmetsp:Transcript_64882/g.156816  ORF Transcript_64882/g.156816 Transcript_64882/m.156816 type:complete len:100 (+) Transcript_64882:173-472(+)